MNQLRSIWKGLNFWRANEDSQQPTLWVDHFIFFIHIRSGVRRNILMKEIRRHLDYKFTFQRSYNYSQFLPSVSLYGPSIRQV